MSTSAIDKAVACWIPGVLYGLAGAADYCWDGQLSPEGVLFLAAAALLTAIPSILLVALMNEDRRFRRAEVEAAGRTGPAALEDQMRESTVPTILERTTSASPK